METSEEESREKLTEDQLLGNVNELVFPGKNHQGNKREVNKIPGEEMPKNISSSKESSKPVHHHLKW